MSITFRIRRLVFSSISLRSLSSSASSSSHHHALSVTTSRTRIPLPRIPRGPTAGALRHRQFEAAVETLKPGFTCADVIHVIWDQPDPNIAFDIFRWTGHQRNYKHDASAYQNMIEIAVHGNMPRNARTLVEEVLAGACPISLSLYNSIIWFCCSLRLPFIRAVHAYKKMLNSEDCKPDLETYRMMFTLLLRKFSYLEVSYISLHGVRSLTKQMNSVGVIPDLYIFNKIIKAFSKCLMADKAIRTLREMGLCGCKPDGQSYGYIITALCQKGMVVTGFRFYKEMRERGLSTSLGCYKAMICSLAIDGKIADAVEVLYDMIRCGRSPDMLTYKTILEEMCRAGKESDAFELVEDLRKKDVCMSPDMYQKLLDQLHFIIGD